MSREEGLLAWAPAPSSDPTSSDELAWLADAPWAKVGLLVLVAMIVLALTNLLRAGKKGQARRPLPDFDLEVARLEQLPVSSIVTATEGPVHIEGVLVDAEGAMGPRAMVFHNRAGGQRATAIAAEFVLLSDGKAALGLENLDHARVIAPREPASSAARGRASAETKTISLLLGDRVQVLGKLLRFDKPRPIAGREELLIGSLGSLGAIQVRVLERSPAPSPAPPDSTTDTTTEASETNPS